MGHVFHRVSHAITHAVQSVTHPVTNLISHVPIVGQPVANALNSVAEHPLNPLHAVKAATEGAIDLTKASIAPLMGGQEAAPAQAATSAPMQMSPSSTLSAQVAVPVKDETADEETASSKKKGAKSGKKALTVSRQSGQGLSL